jgi:hypothetical protein
LTVTSTIPKAAVTSSSQRVSTAIDLKCKAASTSSVTSDSPFQKPGDTSVCQQAYDDSIEKKVKDPPRDLKDACGNDTACIIDAVISGDPNTGKETKTDERNLEKKSQNFVTTALIWWRKYVHCPLVLRNSQW